MGKKLTIEFVRDVFEKEGYTLLNSDYTGNTQPLKIKSFNGDFYTTTWLSWQQGKRPWKDARCLQPTIEHIRESFSEKGYTLISKEYTNSKTRLEFVCDRGHKHSMVWPSWKKGHICKYCNYEDRKGRPKYKYKVNYNDSPVVNGIIYKVTNKINDKIYIGQTINKLKERKLKHLALGNSTEIKTHFHRAINKHGKENFTWEIIERCNSKQVLDEREIYYIEYYDTYKNGYNMTLGGEGTIGRICKESTKRKISRASKGLKRSEELKKKMSEMRLGVKKSKEHVKNVAASVSKYWEITYPDGNTKVVRNLSAFCRENNLNDNGMRLVALYGRNHHKRFKCKRIDNIGEVNNGR